MLSSQAKEEKEQKKHGNLVNVLFSDRTTRSEMFDRTVRVSDSHRPTEQRTREGQKRKRVRGSLKFFSLSVFLPFLLCLLTEEVLLSLSPKTPLCQTGEGSVTVREREGIDRQTDRNEEYRVCVCGRPRRRGTSGQTVFFPPLFFSPPPQIPNRSSGGHRGRGEEGTARKLGVVLVLHVRPCPLTSFFLFVCLSVCLADN
mmetsp:Transcript_25219/g.49262  ORF Transcript_25219/g.49262 Transcript_25219/m.49262 type:complete len:200 (+) Transcript_25219:1750-2349(+)